MICNKMHLTLVEICTIIHFMPVTDAELPIENSLN